MSDPARKSPVWLGAAWFISALVIALLLQMENRAYEADFGGHPDEAAHVVTGLMVRDYMAGGFSENAHPLRYAESYVESYPKVAIGHYPPLFYLLEGLWMMPQPSPTAALVLSAVLAAGCATLVFLVGRRMLPHPLLAVAAALFVLLLPLAQKYTAIVMADFLQALLCLAAVAAFARFAGHGAARWSLAFGVLATCAILTKAAGLLLALVPPLWIVLGRRFDLLGKRALWLAPIPVLLFALPWTAMTYSITKEGARDIGFGAYIAESVPFYAGGLLRVFGVVLLVLAALGAWRALRSGKGLALGCVVLFCSTIVFFVIVPSGLDDRYLLVVVPVVLLLAALGGSWLCGLAPQRARPALWVAVLVGCVFSAGGFVSPDKFSDGYSQAIAAIGKDADGAKVHALASSDARGEGALIASSAFRSDRRPAGDLLVARGSKMLADVKWLGQDYELKFGSSAALREKLLESVDYLIVDTAIPPGRRRPDHDSIERMLAEYPADFSELASVPTRRPKQRTGELKIFRVKGGADGS